MSTKKDKFSKKDKLYMKIALGLAKSKHGLTGPNPSVGCVIVKNDKIISVGITSYDGRLKHSKVVSNVEVLWGLDINESQ